MMLTSVGVIYGVLGCLVLSYTDAQQYYSQENYYKQFPQYAQSKSNGYHGYSTPAGINSNANSVQVIEVSIPNLPNLPNLSGVNFGISKSDESIISGVIKQYLSSSAQAQSGPTVPYTVSIHSYNDKKPPNVNPQNVYGNQATINTQSQYNQAANNYQQPNYYQQQQQQQQQQIPYDYNNYNYKQQQHQREVAIYEQKLREYYAQYPSAAPQPVTTTALPYHPTELIKPNVIVPTKHEPIPDDGKSLSDLLNDNLGFGKEHQTTEHTTSSPISQPSDGKSLKDLINEATGTTKSPQTTPPSTVAPKKSLDDLIGNVFTEKPHTTTEEPPKVEGGKSLLELIAELSPPETDTGDLGGDAFPELVKTKSDVAGGDYGLDVRADDSKVTRTKRSIIREGLRRITEKISNFGKNDNARHTRDHECSHHEGHSLHSNHRHDDADNNDGFIENHRHDKHKGRHQFENDRYGYEHGHPHPHYPHPHPHPYPHHVHPHSFPHPNNDYDKEEDGKHHHNEKPRPSDASENPINQNDQDVQVTQPSRKPHSVDAGTQTDEVVATNTDEKDPTLDIDVRGGFSETRRKRHNLKRYRRSPDDEEGFVFQDDEEKTPKEEVKVADEAKKDDEVVADEIKKDDGVTEADPNTTEKEGEDGDLDSRFGLFGAFNRQPGRRPIANLIGGVIGGALGGLNGAFDPYNRAPSPQPYYPYGQQYPQQPQQPPVHIHINNVANAQAQAVNQASGPFGLSGSNQNAAANAGSENYQNQFGSFQNNGASGQASNLGADGSGQLSAANSMNQNYQNEFGFGSKNTAQSQAANFDNHGNLGLTSSNSGTNHFAGPGGVFDETNSAAQSSQQGQFGTQNSGAQSNTFQGPNGSGASASSQASSINNGHGSQNSGANAAANSGNFGGNSFGNAQSNTYANDQWGW